MQYAMHLAAYYRHRNNRELYALWAALCLRNAMEN
jgi:hypothetical protein